jgi:hypothetical protein
LGRLGGSFERRGILRTVGKRTVTFWYKDKKLRRRVYLQRPLEEFVDRWALHIPERYQHAVRCFGLFAPRPLRQTSAAIFLILGQERRQRPKPHRWADSLKRDFGHDPLLDHNGQRMTWRRRIAPKTCNSPTQPSSNPYNREIRRPLKCKKEKANEPKDVKHRNRGSCFRARK